jgi:hypothetical protein
MTIVEVAISALVLAVIVVGTLTAFDAAGRFSGQDQRRSEANDLAQQDQDRLRGMQVTQLSSLNQTRAVTLDGSTFTIKSTGQFETESTGTPSCASTGSADFIKTTSTVTWPTMGSRPPVVAESVITPPAGGALIVQVVDGHGNGVPGMNVSGSGPSTLSATTGSDGCAIFGGLPGGTYNVTATQSGYVDKDGNSISPSGQQITSVIAGSSVTKTFYFDQAGQIQATFDTRPYGAATAVPSSADTVTIFNNNMTFPGFRWAGTSNQYVSKVTATAVFPFYPSSYTVYAGSCTNDAPSEFGSGPDPSLVVPQGGTGSILLHLPPVNLTVYDGILTKPPVPLAGAHVVLTDQGCGGNPPVAGGSPAIKRTRTTNSSGQLADPGQPFGTFNVCADDGGKFQQATVVNDVLGGTSLTLDLRLGLPGKCT